MPSVADSHAFAHLQRHLSDSLGPLIGIAFSNVSGETQSLYPEERQTVAKAILKRRQEFAAGRKAARIAMRDIGWPAMPIACRADRSPAWPAGLVGSISHSNHACMAVVGRKAHVESIGIDIEDQLPIGNHLWPAICTSQELASISKLPRAAQGLMVTRIFSAKEAFYKWQYPLTGRLLDFQDVAIVIDAYRSTFSARCTTVKSIQSNFARARGYSFNERNYFISTIINPVALGT